MLTSFNICYIKCYIIHVTRMWYVNRSVITTHGRYAISDVSMIYQDTYKVFICISVQRENLFLSKMYGGETFETPFPSAFPPCLSLPRSVRGFSLEKAFGKVIIVVAARWRVYAHHGNIERKGNPRRQAPLSNFGQGKGKGRKGTSYCNRL